MGLSEAFWKKMAAKIQKALQNSHDPGSKSLPHHIAEG